MVTRVVHVDKEPYDVYIGDWNMSHRLRKSKWANPHKIGWCDICKAEHTRQETLVLYEQHVRSKLGLMAALPELEGKTLGCWCKDPKDPTSCHGDVLVELIEMSKRKKKMDDGEYLTG